MQGTRGWGIWDEGPFAFGSFFLTPETQPNQDGTPERNHHGTSYQIHSQHLLFLTKSLHHSILSIKKWEPDVGMKIFWLREAEKAPSCFLFCRLPRKRAFSHDISNKTSSTRCPHLLLPVHPSVHPPDCLFSLSFLLPVNWLLDQSLNLRLILFNPFYNIQSEGSWIRRVLGLSHTPARSRFFQYITQSWGSWYD